MNKKILAIGLVLFTATAAVAQQDHTADPAAAGFNPLRLARIDQAIQTEVAAGKIPGAVALVARNGTIVYHKRFGFADIDSKTPMQKHRCRPTAFSALLR